MCIYIYMILIIYSNKYINEHVYDTLYIYTFAISILQICFLWIHIDTIIYSSICTYMFILYNLLS